MIEKPEYSYTANAILNAYNDIARGRRYEQGVPLTLSPHDLMAYIQMNELPCEQNLFCEAIFMLDNDFIDEHRKMSERRNAVQGSKKRPS